LLNGLFNNAERSAGVGLRQDHWLPGFNFNVEEWDAEGLTYETLAICLSLDRIVCNRHRCSSCFKQEAG
jgi:hypothetical protein